MKFNRIYIEITNYCNLNCSFCSKDNRLKKEMTKEEFEIVINKIKKFTSNIYLHVKGEPLLHKELDEILTICDNNNINVKITTNGTLLKQKEDILLNHHIKQINISLHSENNYKDYFKNVFTTCDKLKEKTTIIYRLWVLKTLNIEKLSTKIVDKINEHYHLTNEIINKLLTEKNIKINDNIYIDKDYEFTWPHLNEDKSTKGSCLGTRTHIAILSDGTVVPCCLDSNGTINLGNIFDKNLEDIINSELFQKINNGFKNQQIYHPLCQSCTYRKRFDKNINNKQKEKTVL